METKTNDRLKTILKIIGVFLGGHIMVLVLAGIFGKQITSLFNGNLNYRAFGLEAVWALIVIACIAICGKTSVFKISKKQMIEGLGAGILIIALYLFFILIVIPVFFVNDMIPVPEIICCVLQWFLVGVVEEGLYRGAIMSLFSDIYGNSRKGAFLSIISSAVMFGLVHLLNVRIDGISMAAVTVQVLSAIALGLVFGAITYRAGGKIWPAIIIHALVDTASFIGNGVLWGGTESEAIGALDPRSLILIPIEVGIFLFLMRKSKCSERV